MELLGLANWIVWGLIAAGLLAVEMLTTTYVALGLAVGAVVAAVVSYLAPELHPFVQALIWATVGLVVWLALSRRNKQRHKQPDINDFDPVDSLPREDQEQLAARRKRD